MRQSHVLSNSEYSYYEQDQAYGSIIKHCLECNKAMTDTNTTNEICRECAEQRWYDRQQTKKVMI